VLEWLSSPAQQASRVVGAGEWRAGELNPEYWIALAGLPVGFDRYPDDWVVDCINSDYDVMSLCSALGAFEEMHVQDCSGSKLTDEL